MRLQAAKVKGTKTKNTLINEKLELICYKCKVHWKDQNFFERKSKWLECISCENKAHNVCIQIRYLQKTQIDTSGSEFLCEVCNKLNESDDSLSVDNEEEEEF